MNVRIDNPAKWVCISADWVTHHPDLVLLVLQDGVYDLSILLNRGRRESRRARQAEACSNAY